MDRLLYNDLLSWKRQLRRKPVLIDGARQTGKTHLIEQIFGARQFRKVHKLDFNFAPGLASVFADGLAPRTIVDNIEVRFNEPVDLARDLIFFDEVGDCQSALDSLKYFAEQMPNAFICATGSNIGLLTSFPVGKVSRLELFPLCFEEFVMASGQTRLLEMFRTRAKSSTAHERLWSLFLDYTFVGGMPEAVAAWFDPRHGMAQRISQVETIHSDLVTGFERDFGKYAGPAHAQHIDAVFHNIPRQLETTLDGSVKRFRFQGVVARKRGYQDLRGSHRLAGEVPIGVEVLSHRQRADPALAASYEGEPLPPVPLRHRHSPIPPAPPLRVAARAQIRVQGFHSGELRPD